MSLNLNYIKWFDLEVQHTYFPEAIAQHLQLEPVRSCKKLMDNWQVKMNTVGNRFGLYVGVSNDSSLSEALSAFKPLFFLLKTTDPLFWNYTSIPELESNQKLFYSSSNQTNQSKGLVPQKLPIFHSTGNMSVPTGMKQLIVKTTAGNEVLSIENKDSKTPLLFDFTSLDVGVYQLWFDQKLQYNFFLIDQSIEGDTVAILELDPSQISSSISASILFESPKAFLTYQIVIPTKKKINPVKISINHNGGVSWSSPKDITIAQNTAYEFTSSKPISIQQKMENNPQLKLDYSSGFSNHVNHIEVLLPNPPVSQLKTYKSGKQKGKLYLPSIVYV